MNNLRGGIYNNELTKHLGVGKKITLVTSLACIFVSLVGSAGMYSISKMNTSSNLICNKYLTTVKDLEGINGNIAISSDTVLTVLYEQDPSKLKSRMSTIDYIESGNGIY